MTSEKKSTAYRNLQKLGKKDGTLASLQDFLQIYVCYSLTISI